MAPLFNEETNRRIVHYMRLHGDDPNCFVKLSKEIPRYKPRQIANHWRNFLDPYLCTLPLNNEEKIFIVKQTQIYKTLKVVIGWKKIIRDLEIKFGRRHSEFKVKSFMGSKNEYIQRKYAKLNPNRPLEPNVKINPKFPKPQKMVPVF